MPRHDPPSGAGSSRRRAVWRWCGVLAVLGVLAGAAVVGLRAGRGGVAPARPFGPYVALGDSYTAGPGIPALTGAPLACLRSTQDYPAQVAALLRPSRFTDVSCSGATVADLTGPQDTRTGPNPPQLDALAPDTSLVTVGIGGNDIGFGDIVHRCLTGIDADCRDHYVRAGHDELADRISATGPRLAAVLREITRRAPTATVLVVGYPTILPVGGGCDQARVSPADLAYLTGTFLALNAMLRSTAEAQGARFVDTSTASVGHDLCAPDGQAWITGRSPAPGQVPFHPGVPAMRSSASQVLRSVTAID